MIERLCEKCSKLVKNKLFSGMRRNCYDRSRKISSVAVPKKLEPFTARHAARGRLAHQICRVEICPCRIDFS